jgi:hypothetical protein
VTGPGGADKVDVVPGEDSNGPFINTQTHTHTHTHTQIYIYIIVFA